MPTEIEVIRAEVHELQVLRPLVYRLLARVDILEGKPPPVHPPLYPFPAPDPEPAVEDYGG